MTDRTLASPLANARAAMEAAACGAAVVFVGDDAGFLPEGVARVVATEEEAVAACSELARDGHGAGLASVHARRAIYSAHTYAHRLQEICRKLGLDHRWDEWPLVSAITPTKRPGRLAEAYRRFQMQTYPNKEWIVVVNTTAAGGEDEIERISVDDRVTVLRLHEENNIGRCLNVAIRRSQGAYWFKMDDDDYYGPEYLADMMLELRGVDADVLGKPTAFVYLEAEDLLLRRAGALRAEHIVATADVPHMCGATISGARSVLDTVAFSEDIRASVDTDFVQRCRDAGLAIYLSNIFGFVVLRQADKSQHTWRADDDSLRSNAQPIGDGRVLSDVLG